MFARLDVQPGLSFYSVGHLVGATDDDVVAFSSLPQTDARRDALVFSLTACARALLYREPAGHG